jgi:hypothetical protein
VITTCVGVGERLHAFLTGFIWRRVIMWRSGTNSAGRMGLLAEWHAWMPVVRVSLLGVCAPQQWFWVGSSRPGLCNGTARQVEFVVFPQYAKLVSRSLHQTVSINYKVFVVFNTEFREHFSARRERVPPDHEVFRF